MDLGGTKAHVVVADTDGRRIVDEVVPSAGWEAEPTEAAVVWVDRLLAAFVPPDESPSAVVVGAQGVDRPETAQALEKALSGRGMAVSVVNDAALLVPAAGLDQGLAVIAGTGAVGVGLDAGGVFMMAGGWGSVIGDDAGATGIVRDAVRAALAAHDHGDRDDGLLAALLTAFDAADAERLARCVNDEPTVANWAPHAPVVFEASAAGSHGAAGVVDRAGHHLAVLIHQLARRGAVGSTVVASGSVISNQPALFEAFERHLRSMCPDLEPILLGVDPVEGAIRIGYRLAAAAASRGCR
jgi:N-acetylglucosamine kinase-like BadF-type ATPase